MAAFHLRYGLVVVGLMWVSAATLAEESIAAVLKAHEVGFSYRSTSVLLPCYELENRVAVILRSIGARDDVKVSATSCESFVMGNDIVYGRDDGFGRDRYGHADPFNRADPFDRRRDRFRGARNMQREQNSYVRVWLMAPVPVTPQVLAEMDKDKSRRELISRVTGNPMAAMNDPIVFAAQRQAVTLSRKTLKLEPEDCELLEQMSRSVFRELDVRVMRGALSCGNGRTMIAPQVTVEALLPVGYHIGPPPTAAAPQPPASSDPEAHEPPAPSDAEPPAP